MKDMEEYNLGFENCIRIGNDIWFSETNYIDLLSGYGSASEPLKRIIMKEKDLEVLCAWLKTVAAVTSVEEFEEKM